MPGLPTPPDPSSLCGRRAHATCPGGARAPRRGRGQPVRGGPPVHRAGRRRPPGLRRHQRERTGGGRDRGPSARHAAGHRARGGPDQAPLARTRSSAGSSTSSTSWPRAGATCRSGSRPCAARSPGATTCSMTAAAGCSTGCRCSPGGATSKRRGGHRSGVGARHRRASTASMALADQSLVRVDESTDGEPRFGLLDIDPRVRGRAARGAWRARDDPRPASRLVRGAGGARPPRARRATTSGAGSTGSSSPTTTSARSSTGRSPRPDPRRRDPARIRDVAVLAEARPPRRRRGGGSRRWRPRRGRATTRDCGRACSRRSAGVCWWQADLPPMGAALRGGARASGRGSATMRELANAYYNVSFSYAVERGRDVRDGDRRARRGVPRAALEAFRKPATSAARPTRCGALAPALLPGRGGRRRGGVPAGARALPQDWATGRWRLVAATCSGPP